MPGNLSCLLQLTIASSGNVFLAASQSCHCHYKSVGFNSIYFFVCLLVNIGQSAFQSLAKIVERIHELLKDNVDNHGRSTLLLSFVTYVFNAPFAVSPAPSYTDLYKGMSVLFFAYVYLHDLNPRVKIPTIHFQMNVL